MIVTTNKHIYILLQQQREYFIYHLLVVPIWSSTLQWIVSEYKCPHNWIIIHCCWEWLIQPLYLFIFILLKATHFTVKSIVVYIVFEKDFCWCWWCYLNGINCKNLQEFPCINSIQWYPYSIIVRGQLPSVISFVILVVNLSCGISQLIVISQWDIPRNIKLGLIINWSLILCPERICIRCYSIIVEIISDYNEKVNIRRF